MHPEVRRRSDLLPFQAFGWLGLRTIAAGFLRARRPSSFALGRVSLARRPGEAGHRIEGHRRLIFASVLLMVLGLFILLDGFAAVARWHVFIANAHYLIGDLRIIAVDMVALYGLCVYGSCADVTE